MRSPFRVVIGAAVLLRLGTLAHASTWSVRLDDSTFYTRAIERVPSGGMVTSSPYRLSPGILVVGLDESGEVIWQSLLSRPAGTQGSDAVIRPSADGYFAATNIGLFNEPENAWLAKLDASGGILWQRTLTGGAGFTSAHDVVALADGGCLLLGSLFSDGVEKLWVMRVDASGATEWSETMDNAGIVGGAARELANGDFVLTAQSTGPGAGISGLVIRLRPDGSIAWQRSINGPTAVDLPALATTASGDILVGGSLGNLGQGGGRSGALLVRLNAEGTLLGSRLYRGYLTINGIAATADGRIALAGNVLSAPDPFQQWEDGFVIIADATGTPLAASTHGGPGQDGINAIVESGDGGFLLAGLDAADAASRPYALVQKVDAWGAVGSACARISPRVIEVDTRPITARPSSAVVAPFAPTASPLALTNVVVDPVGADLVCAAP